MNKKANSAKELFQFYAGAESWEQCEIKDFWELEFKEYPYFTEEVPLKVEEVKEEPNIRVLNKKE